MNSATAGHGYTERDGINMASKAIPSIESTQKGEQEQDNRASNRRPEKASRKAPVAMAVDAFH